MYKPSQTDITFAERQAYLKHKSYRYVDIEELISAAYEGLVEAAQSFNPNKGVKFTTYSFKGIYQRMDEAIKFLNPDCEYIELDELPDPHSIINNTDLDLSILNEDELELINTISNLGLSVKQYAKVTGVSDSTIYRKIKNIKKKLLNAS